MRTELGVLESRGAAAQTAAAPAHGNPRPPRRLSRIPLARGAAALLWAGVLGSLAATAVVASHVTHPRLRERILTAADWSPVEGTACVSCRITGDLPRWERRWDGEPPRAWIERSGLAAPSSAEGFARGNVVAPPLLSFASLSGNRRGAVWDEQAGIVGLLPADEASQPLRLVVEEVPSSRGLAGCLILTALLSIAAAGLPAWLRGSGRAALWPTGCMAASWLVGLAFYPGGPSEAMSSDAMNINSFAAAQRHPAAFAADGLLHDRRHFDWYTPAYVQFAAAVGALGLHDSTHAAVLAVLATWSALTGYRRLFEELSAWPLFAMSAAAALWFQKTSYPPNENWALLHILPRTVFAGLLPWVLLLAVRLADRPRLWWLAGAAAASLFYVHPVSAPAICGVVLLGMLLAGWGRLRDRLGWGILAGLAALAVMLPYGFVYGRKYAGTVVGDEAVVRAAWEAARTRFAAGFIDLPVFFRDLAVWWALNPVMLLGTAAAVACWRRERFSAEDAGRGVRLLGGMSLGLAIVAFALPAVDLSLARAWGRLPFQVDLIRNARYLELLALCWTARALRTGRHEPAYAAAWLVRGAGRLGAGRTPTWGAAVLLLLGLALAPRDAVCLGRLSLRAANQFAQLWGRWPADAAEERELLNAVAALAGPDEAVYGPLWLRQAGIPVAVMTKDLGCLAYADPQGLLDAQRLLRDAAVHEQGLHDAAALEALSRLHGVRWLALERERLSPGVALRSDVVFANRRWVLIERNPEKIAIGR